MLTAAKKFFAGEESEQRPELTLLTTPTLTVTLTTPTALRDIPDCGQTLIDGHALLLDFSNLDIQERRQAQDYLAGVCYVLDADVAKVSEDVLLYTPQGVEIEK